MIHIDGFHLFCVKLNGECVATAAQVLFDFILGFRDKNILSVPLIFIILSINSCRALLKVLSFKVRGQSLEIRSRNVWITPPRFIRGSCATSTCQCKVVYKVTLLLSATFESQDPQMFLFYEPGFNA